MDYKFWVNDFDRVKDHRKKFQNVAEIFKYPVSFWYSRPSKNLRYSIERLLARAHPGLPVIVIYNLPDRDIGQYSAGGAKTMEDYILFVNEISLGIGSREPIVIFEPDALPHCNEMSEGEKKERMVAMATAIGVISDTCNAKIYLDIGNSLWLDPEAAGNLINSVMDLNPIDTNVRGFSVNVSNYRTTEESMEWALEVGRCTKFNHFVIDTSRNGRGPFGQDWCNPPGRGLGTPPTTNTGHDLCDAFLWIKIPGESDGQCNGGPRAGKFWPEYANTLVENTYWIN